LILLDNLTKSFPGGTPDELKGSVRSEVLPDPTLNDAFIALIEQKSMPS